MTRRTFVAASTAAGVGCLLANQACPAPKTTTLHKALIGSPNDTVLQEWKAAGIEGVEWKTWNVSPHEAMAVRKRVELAGMRIHSLMFGWGQLNGGTAAMADTVAKMETALHAAQLYGADTVLFVPCRIDVTLMPEPWEFDVRFDERTGHVHQVVAGDNAKYRPYIETHNQAVDASREGVQKLIPTAEKAGVVIALENVWNNLWVKPDLAANFVASFQSPWVKAYFDTGNHVKYAPPPQDWIRTLGKLLMKCHVKDFKFGPDGHGGKFCNIRDGCVNWPAVRGALDEVGYNGWLTVEGSSLSPQEHSKRLDLIIAGK